MKENLKYLTLLLLFITVSCVQDNDVEPLFKGSINERADALRADYIKVLTSAENGWIGYYSPNGEAGGYTLLLNFNEDGTVDMKSDYRSGENDAVITYRLDKTLKVELVFETHSVLHQIFETKNNDFGGEFVFNMLEVANSEITLESKTDNGYNGEEITILKIIPASASDLDLEEVYNMATNLAVDETKSVFRNVIANGTAIASFSYDEGTRLTTVSYISDGELEIKKVGVNITPNGFNFIKPLNINDTILTSFVWNTDTELFEDTANNAVIDYDNVPAVPLTPYAFGKIKDRGRYNYIEKYKSSKAFTNFYDGYVKMLLDDHSIEVTRWYMRDLTKDLSRLDIRTNTEGKVRFDFTFEIKDDGKVYFTLTGATNASANLQELLKPLIKVMVGSESGYYIRGTGKLFGGLYPNGTFSLINADNPIYETNYYDF